MCSDESEVECDDPDVVLTRYKKAQLRRALSFPDNYHRACQELFDIYRANSECTAARVKKAVLAELSSDTRLAIELCDGISRNTTICKALVSQSVRALPQAKGKDLHRLLKAHGLKSAREDNKHVKSLQQCGAPPAMEQISADILGSVLNQLDPFNLAAAACTSKQWQEEAYKEHRWQPFAIAITGTASSAGQQQPWRKLFFEAAMSGHTRIAYFRTRRRMLKQTLLWTDAGPWQGAPDLRCVTPRQVATFILKGSIKEDRQDDTDSSEDEESTMCSSGHRNTAPAFHKLWRTTVRCELKQGSGDEILAAD